LFEIFLIVTKIQGDVTRKFRRFSCKVPDISMRP